MKLLSALALVLATTAAHADNIISTVGLNEITAPPIVGADFLINQGLLNQVIFAEQQGVTLLAPLVTDTGTIAAGTRVDSYFFAVNTFLNNETVADTSVTFSTPVLGMIFQENMSTGVPSPNFASSDFLGLPGTSYGESSCQFCAFENANQTQALADAAHFSLDTATFHNDYSVPGDFARIIVQDPVGVPGPVVGAGLPGLLAGLMGIWGWRRRRAVQA